MNWAQVSFDWNQVRAFLATAQEGSFSAAARALRSTQPTMGRQVSALEEELGLTLFERGGRTLRLTAVGIDLLRHVEAMGEAATRISLAAAGHAQEVSGQVSITATDLMSTVFLPRLLGSVRRIAPRVELRIVASNTIENLSQRDADIAIRHVEPKQAQLVARRLPDGRAGLYAAASYLEHSGRPSSLEELEGHVFIGGEDPVVTQAALAQHGVAARREQFVLGAGNGAVVWGLAKAGLGIALLPEMLATLEPSVERVLPQLPPLHFPVWLTTHRELHTSPRIRVVFDALAEGMLALLQP